MTYPTSSFIQKDPRELHETTPFVWGGDLHRACFNRVGTAGTGIRIDKYDAAGDSWDKQAFIEWPRGLGCVLVDDGKLYAFGTTDWGTPGNSIKMQEIDPATWTLTGSETNVITAPSGVTYYNSSVCKGPDKFVMVLETDEATSFSGKFLESTDLATWSPIGAIMRPDTYCACPTIRYMEHGFYWITWLWKHSENGQNYYITNNGRTKDFITVSTYQGNAGSLLSPMDATYEGTNNSDADFCEWNGKVYLCYLTGDQATWGYLKDAWYEGALLDLYREYWPSGIGFRGDSITEGFGVEPEESYVNLLAGELGKPIVFNTADGGHQAADQAWLCFDTEPSLDYDTYVLVGPNDVIHYGAASVRVAAYAEFLRHIAVWHACPVKTFGQSLTKTGAWTDSSHHLARFSTELNAKLSGTIEGDVLYVGYRLQNSAGSEGKLEVKVDGVTVGYIEPKGTQVGNTYLGRVFSDACARFQLSSGGSHNVEIINKISGKSVAVNFIAGNAQAEKPLVVIGDIPPQTNNPAHLPDYNVANHAVADGLIADGLNVRKAALNTALDTQLHYLDYVHQNADGQSIIKTTFAGA